MSRHRDHRIRPVRSTLASTKRVCVDISEDNETLALADGPQPRERLAAQPHEVFLARTWLQIFIGDPARHLAKVIICISE